MSGVSDFCSRSLKDKSAMSIFGLGISGLFLITALIGNNDTENIKKEENEIKSPAITVVLFVLELFVFAMAIVLLRGIYSKKPGLLGAWLISEVFSWLTALILFIVMVRRVNGFVFFLVFFTLLVLLSMLTVYSYKKQMEESISSGSNPDCPMNWTNIELTQ